MDALLLSLILSLSISADSALASHYRALSLSRTGAALVALVGTAIAIAVIAALGGLWFRSMFIPEARGLFLAFALAVAGGALFFRAQPLDMIGQPMIAIAKLFLAGMGSNALLLVAAIGCWFADPWMASIGGGLGCIAGCVMARVVLPDYRRSLRFFRFAAGGAMLIGAFLLAMSALRLL